MWDSNPRSPHYKYGALPTVLMERLQPAGFEPAHHE